MISSSGKDPREDFFNLSKMDGVFFKSAFALCLLLYIFQRVPLCTSADDQNFQSDAEIKLMIGGNSDEVFEEQISDEDVLHIAYGMGWSHRSSVEALRETNVEIPASEENNTPVTHPPKTMHRWFPSDKVPREHPSHKLQEFDTIQPKNRTPENQLQSFADQLNETVNMLRNSDNQLWRTEAILHGDFTRKVEGDEFDNQVTHRKHYRQRRDLRSEMEAKKKLAETLKRRQTIEKQRMQARTAASPPRRNHRNQAVARKKKPIGEPSMKKQTYRKPGSKVTQRFRTTPLSPKKSPKPRTGTQRSRTPSTTRTSPKKSQKPRIGMQRPRSPKTTPASSRKSPEPRTGIQRLHNPTTIPASPEKSRKPRIGVQRTRSLTVTASPEKPTKPTTSVQRPRTLATTYFASSKKSPKPITNVQRLRSPTATPTSPKKSKKPRIGMQRPRSPKTTPASLKKSPKPRTDIQRIRSPTTTLASPEKSRKPRIGIQRTRSPTMTASAKRPPKPTTSVQRLRTLPATYFASSKGSPKPITGVQRLRSPTATPASPKKSRKPRIDVQRTRSPATTASPEKLATSTTSVQRPWTLATTYASSKMSPKQRTGRQRPRASTTKQPLVIATNIIRTTAASGRLTPITPRHTMNTSKPAKTADPKQGGPRLLSQRTLESDKPSKERSKATVPPKKNAPKPPKRSATKKKSTNFETIIVVKPVVLTDGRRTTETIQQKSSFSQRGFFLSNRPRLTFSKWGPWNPCQARECGSAGTQIRTRTCFGSKLTASDYAICNYNSLVYHRSCVAAPCVTVATEPPPNTAPSTHVKKTFRWSAWTKCSVTCGAGGKQTRLKICYEHRGDRAEDMIRTDCLEETLAARPCQYSVSCPMWDSWSTWTSCSKTCGTGGVSSRDRKCVVERYVSFRNKGESEGSDQTPRRRQFESAIYRPRPKLQEPSGTKKKNSLKSSQGQRSASNRNRRRNSKTRGFAYLKNGLRVFIVDAPRPEQDASSPKRPVPQFYEEETVKEFVNIKLCSKLGSTPEEERRCFEGSCPAEWASWNTWSSCTVTCGMGISRRERSCTGISSSHCIGRKYAYRRCYAPPCWREWSQWGDCSASCGSAPGVKERTRTCFGSTAFVPEYSYCEGESRSVEPCLPEPCPGERWSSWGPYEACSKSCNGGYRRRARECRAFKCTGPSEDFGRCNIHKCPTWSRWSLYSCCSVSCGEGVRRRTRTCLNGKIKGAGCIGKSEDFESCYRRPCGNVRKPIFGNFRCGIGSVSNLKTIARLRIFGGAQSAAHDWPWQTSWQHRESQTDNWEHFCGATLLHPRWVITASHCTEESEFIVNHRNPGENWSVVIGMVKLNRDGTRYFLERIFIHPKYRYKSVTKNDIALLKLRKMVPITDEVMPACMPKGMRPPPGEECYATGWGYTTGGQNASLSVNLREARIPIMKFQQCRALGDYYRFFLHSSMHMCAGNAVTASDDSCTGDSGGPLVCGRNDLWYLAAVTSFGFADCGTPGHVGIYAPMDSYESWTRVTLYSHTYERC